jgi:hypothetical protein
MDLQLSVAPQSELLVGLYLVYLLKLLPDILLAISLVYLEAIEGSNNAVPRPRKIIPTKKIIVHVEKSVSLI